jgi:glutathione synthase/RimK-type ligase-like ATP-grasp enzyme
MANIGICFARELQGNTPLAHIITKLPVYIRLFELMAKKDWNTYALTTKTYRGSGIFEGGWRFEKGKFYLTKDVLKIDLVYDKTGGVAFPLENDSLRVVNEHNFKILACDKWATYQALGKYMPQTFIIENREDLSVVLSKIDSDMVVLKPVGGLKGIGIFIGNKENAKRFEFNKKYGKYIAQEFVDTTNGIPGLTSGNHDLRIVVINGKAVWCHIRVPAEGSLLANAAQGGSLTEVDYREVPSSIKDVVNKVTKMFTQKFDNPVYSLDFGMGKDETPYIFEINDTMGFPKWGMKNRDIFLNALINNFKSKLLNRGK